MAQHALLRALADSSVHVATTAAAALAAADSLPDERLDLIEARIDAPSARWQLWAPLLTSLVKGGRTDGVLDRLHSLLASQSGPIPARDIPFARAAALSGLAGVTDPQEKRRRIGSRFIDVFKGVALELKDARFLAQGTLYPDVIESGHGHAGHAAGIKLHHNVGGLPADLGFELVEPLRDLFKDEVRKLGEVLGLPDAIVWRHPFPGPGLSVRVLGEVTRPRLDLLRECDEILQEEVVANNLHRQLSQVFTVLLPIQSVGVMGDGRTYESVVAVRAVETQDFMTADWARIPYAVLETISGRIINEVRGVNRVVYDISSKPPATIEWE